MHSKCRIVVAGHRSFVLCLRRVVADQCCMSEDMYDRYSTKIVYVVKDCY